MTPPGWYPAPDDPGRMAYWDGSAWRTDEQAPGRGPSRRTWAIIGGIVVAAAGIALGVTQPWAPGSFDLHGSFDLQGTATTTAGDASAAIFEDTASQTCIGINGYSDIAPGAEVDVSDASGTTLAVGHLTGGVFAGDGLCVFEIDVAGIPAGRGPYGVTVTHRGTQHFDESAMRAGNVALTLGSPPQ